MNGASYSPVGLPNSGIARGSMFKLFGDRLGPATSPGLTLPLPTSGGLGGVKIEITPAGGSPIFAIMLHVSPGQLTAILPSSVPEGRASAQVDYNGQKSNVEQFTVVRNSFGIFTLNQAGSGPAVLQNVIADADRPFNTLAQSVRPGEVATLWGTGLGPVTFDETQLPVSVDLNTGVEVYVGGKKANVLYGGRSGYAGIDQVNFTVPNDTPAGCYVPVYVKVNGILSNTTSIAVAGTSGGSRVCSDDTHTFGDNVTSAGQSLGFLALGRTVTSLSVGGQSFDTRADTASGVFQRYDFNGLIQSAGGYSISTYGACTVVTFRGESGGTVVDPIQPQPLDPGTLTLTAPGGVTRDIPRVAQVQGVYAATLSQVTPIPGGSTANFLTAGQYTVTASGGASVGPFTARITLPAPLVWTNAGQINEILRNQGLQITWSGGGPNEYVNMIGTSILTDPQTAGASFVCRERASAGSFTVPADVLSVLPPSAVTQGVGMGFLSVGSASIPSAENRFTATGLDSGYIGYSFTTSKSVTFR